MTSMRRRGVTVGSMMLFQFVFYFGIIMVPLAFWTQRNLDFILTHAKGHTVNVPWILDYVIAFFSPAALLFNIIAEIYRIYVTS